MAEMIIQCPCCSGTLKIQSEWCGLNMKCPLCQKMITVSEEKSAAQLQEESAAAAPDKDIKTTPAKEKSKPKKKGSDGYFDGGCTVILLIAIAVLHLILTCFFSSWPRTLFWLFAPWPALAGLIFMGENNTSCKFGGAMICCYVLVFGWWSHTAGLEKAIKAEQQLEQQRTICQSVCIAQIQVLLKKYAGQKTVFVTEEWNFKPSSLSTDPKVNSKCSYTVNSVHLGKDLKNIPLDDILLSCSEHPKHIIRASALTAVYTTVGK